MMANVRLGCSERTATLAGHGRLALATGCLALSAAGVAGCETHRFDGERAQRSIEQQVSFGPRVPGSEAHAECGQWLADELARHAESVEVLPFDVEVAGRSLKLLNIEARFNPELGERVLLGAHWDSRPISERDPDRARRGEPTPGANDGGSGVAVLLEIARLLGESELELGVDLVLFDGEDYGDFAQGFAQTLLGSQRYAADLDVAAYRYAVVLDMVGRRGLVLRKEGYSLKCCRELMERIWAIAAETGKSATFQDAVVSEVFDDHIPLQRAGLKAIDLIDLTDPHWHTTSDTPEHTSPESLEAVGSVIWELLRREVRR